MTIEVKNLSRSSWLVFETINRTPVYSWARNGIGWAKVRFNNQWFQLFGGIRNDYFIDVSNPI